MAWKGDEAINRMRGVMDQRLHKACIVLKNAIKLKISQSSGRGRTPSAPGQPPHRDTGRLRASISHEVTNGVGRVGTNLKYGKWLELGTKKMAARPYIKPTYRELYAQLIRILKEG